MKKNTRRAAVMTLTISLLMPFLCSFSDGIDETQEYLVRRNYEKILVERFTSSEISIMQNTSTISTPGGYLSACYQGNELTQVSGILNGFSSPIDVQYHYDADGELDRYYNGHLLLEKETEGYTTHYLVDGNRALSITDKPESTTYLYGDGTEVMESRFGDGAFEITNNSNWIYRGFDGVDGMVSCESYDGLQEFWGYDQDGNLSSYESSDSAFYEKTSVNSTTNDILVRAKGLQDAYTVTQNDCLVTYSGLYGNLTSDFDIDTSASSYGFSQASTNWRMQFELRGDKPLEQIGIAFSPYGTYRPSFNDSNIVTSVEKDGVTQKTYQYDGMNRLISSTDSRGTSNYVYDDANNMTKAICMSNEVIGDWFYSYSGNQLASVNGIPLDYDRNGNTIAYGRTNYQWDRGSILTKITSGDLAVSFQYDAMNNPVLRTTDTYDQKRLVWEGNRLVAESDGSRMLSFFYDCFGSPIGFTYNGSIYAYCKNAFQDVVGIVRDDGTLVAEYSYGDFGESGLVTDSNGSGIAYLNPFRYRSYYFDQDLGLYYLRSRWYSPELRRFLSSDSPKVLLQQASKSELLLNKYAYCSNNPISYVDPNGKNVVAAATLGAVVPAFPWLVPFLVVLFVAVVVVAVVGIVAESSQGTSGGTINNPTNPGVSQYEPIPSVAEPPLISEPIAEGDNGVTEQPIPSLNDYLTNASVIAGFSVLEIGLSRAQSSAIAKVNRHYNHPTELHHIIPQRAIDSIHGWLPAIRLYMTGINPSGVNMAENTIRICTVLHKTLHNKAYYNGIAMTFHYPTLTPLPEGAEPFLALLEFVWNMIDNVNQVVSALL